MGFPNVKVVGSANVVRVDLAPSATAYTAGDVIGTAGGAGDDGGKLRLSGALRLAVRTGVWHSLTLFDGSNQKPDLKVLLFAGKPDGAFADNSPPAGLNSGVDGSDKLLAAIAISASDWVTIPGSGGDTAVISKTGLGIVVELAETNDDLYAVFIAGSAPDYIGGSDELVAQFGFLQN